MPFIIPFLVFSKETILKQLELELQQERSKTQSVVADMVRFLIRSAYSHKVNYI